MNNLAVCITNDNKTVTVYETIDAVVNAGFKNVFIQWYDQNFEVSQEEQLKYIKSSLQSTRCGSVGLWLSRS